MNGNGYHSQAMETFHFSNMQDNNVNTNNDGSEVFFITEPEAQGIDASNGFIHKPIDLIVIARKKINIENIGAVAVPTQQLNSWFHLNWRCFWCTHQTVHYPKFLLHLDNSHGIKKAEDMRYQCTECGAIRECYASFMNHLRFMHYPQLKTSCDVCDLYLKHPVELSAHRELTHAGKKYIRPAIFYCSSCERAYATKNELNHHCENHVYICETCQRKFPEKEIFENHMISHSFEQIACVVCGKIFNVSADLEDHIQEHLNLDQYKCRFCVKTFMTCHLRRLHEKIHTSNNQFKCENCKAKFPTHSDLMRHLHDHVEGRLFKCDKCGISYQNKHYLKSHQQFAHGYQSLPNSCDQELTSLEDNSVES